MNTILVILFLLWLLSPKGRRRSSSSYRSKKPKKGKNISPGMHRRNGKLYNTTYSGNKVRSYNVSTGKMTVRKRRK
jgi:hypothetical protein